VSGGDGNQAGHGAGTNLSCPVVVRLVEPAHQFDLVADQNSDQLYGLAASRGERGGRHGPVNARGLTTIIPVHEDSHGHLCMEAPGGGLIPEAPVQRPGRR
jgi:hypothetical protein